MKKNILTYCVLLFSIFHFACPYQSAVAIDKPSEKVKSNYLGFWEDQNEHNTYEVKSYDDYTYSIELSHENNEKQERYLGFISTINNTKFLNKWNFPEDSIQQKYTLMKLEFTGENQLYIFPLTENIQEQFNSSNELKNFISKNKQNSYFFEKPLVLIRKAK